MARNNNRNFNKSKFYGNRNYNRSYGKKRYTQAEKMAFNLGRTQKIVNSLNSGNTESRVYDAFCAGLNGKVSSNKKSLF